MTINSGSRWWNCSVQVYALMLGLGGSDIKALASTILAQWLLCPCPVMVRVVRYLWFYGARESFIIWMICFVWNAHNRSKSFNCFFALINVNDNLGPSRDCVFFQLVLSSLFSLGLCLPLEGIVNKVPEHHLYYHSHRHHHHSCSYHHHHPCSYHHHKVLWTKALNWAPSPPPMEILFRPHEASPLSIWRCCRKKFRTWKDFTALNHSRGSLRTWMRTATSTPWLRRRQSLTWWQLLLLPTNK